MKICWDNLERLRYNKKTGKWYEKKNRNPYFYIEECKGCGESFLAQNPKSVYCCHSCSQVGNNNSFYNKKHTKETKQYISEIGKGKNHSEESKKKMSESKIGKIHTEETKKKISESKKGKCLKEKSSLWDGGYNSNGIPKYDTYASQLEWCEKVRRNENDTNILEVKCFKCGKWFIPKLNMVNNRTASLNGTQKGEQLFYCSKECKHSCSIYHKSPQTLMKEDAIRAGRLGWLELNREVQPELRQMVLERDDYKCVKCGSEGPLHCHHILPVAIEPLLSADIDNCITLCENCHKEAHSQDGCRYGQLRIIEVC
jgi:hypothetical protein